MPEAPETITGSLATTEQLEMFLNNARSMIEAQVLKELVLECPEGKRYRVNSSEANFHTELGNVRPVERGYAAISDFLCTTGTVLRVARNNARAYSYPEGTIIAKFSSDPADIPPLRVVWAPLDDCSIEIEDALPAF